MRKAIIGYLLQTDGAGYSAGGISEPDDFYDFIRQATLRPYSVNDSASIPATFDCPDAGIIGLTDQYSYVGVNLGGDYEDITHILAITSRPQHITLFSFPSSGDPVTFTKITQGDNVLWEAAEKTQMPGFFVNIIWRYSQTRPTHLCPIAELAAVNAITMPTTAKLESTKDTWETGARAEYKTLDGALRYVATSGATKKIERSFVWSDNGETAAGLNEIFKKAADNCRPLLYADIKDTGEHEINIVWPEQQPAITQPEPGIYELALTGRVQP